MTTKSLDLRVVVLMNVEGGVGWLLTHFRPSVNYIYVGTMRKVNA